MNEFLSIFATWQFLLLCIGIAAVTFVIRAVIEYTILNNPKMPGSSKSRFWRDFVLVIIPVVLGMVFPLIGKSFPYPLIINELYGKFLFGATAGLLSPTIYRVIKALLWKNVGDNQPMFPNMNNTLPNISLPNLDDSASSNVDDTTQDPTEPKI